MPLQNIAAIVENSAKNDFNLDFAKKVALNLFNYMQSFNTVLECDYC